jgi:hypothetical protein
LLQLEYEIRNDEELDGGFEGLGADWADGRWRWRWRLAIQRGTKVILDSSVMRSFF